METLANLGLGFQVALQPENLLYCFIGVFVGTLVGVLPGLGPSGALAILVPLVAGLPPTGAIIMLAGIYYGAQYGGSTTAILINTPGEASSVITAVDGYEMSKQGRAGPALGMAAIASFIAGTGSLFGLALIAPPLADVALSFGPPEYFGLTFFALTLVMNLSGRSLLRGLIAGILGILVGSVGIEPMSGVSRFTFGRPELMGGLNFIPIIVGLFAATEVFSNAERPAMQIYQSKLKGLLPTLRDWTDSAGALVRSTLLGFFVGLLPGMTAGVASLLSYDLEKRSSKRPELFGTGRIEGVAAAEGANNSCISGGMVPLLTLGIPTTSSMGLLLGALMIQGLQPGPFLFQQRADFVWGLIASMYLGNVMLLILNLPLVGLWASITRIPYPMLAAGILPICFIGTYSVRNSMFDVWVMIAFGVIGYAMRKLDFPAVPMVIGVLLGDAAERAFRQSLTMSRGDPAIFFTRPISATLMVLALASIALVAYSRLPGKRQGVSRDALS